MRSASAAREAGAGNGSAKYWVSWLDQVAGERHDADRMGGRAVIGDHHLAHPQFAAAPDRDGEMAFGWVPAALGLDAGPAPEPLPGLRVVQDGVLRVDGVLRADIPALGRLQCSSIRARVRSSRSMPCSPNPHRYCAAPTIAARNGPSRPYAPASSSSARPGPAQGTNQGRHRRERLALNATMSNVWKQIRKFLTTDPGRFAGGSALSDPLGLLADQREVLAVRQPPPDGSILQLAQAREQPTRGRWRRSSRLCPRATSRS